MRDFEVNVNIFYQLVSNVFLLCFRRDVLNKNIPRIIFKKLEKLISYCFCYKILYINIHLFNKKKYIKSSNPYIQKNSKCFKRGNVVTNERFTNFMLMKETPKSHITWLKTGKSSKFLLLWIDYIHKKRNLTWTIRIHWVSYVHLSFL